MPLDDLEVMIRYTDASFVGLEERGEVDGSVEGSP